MVMGILGQKQNATSTQDVVYTVPVGKVAVFNIFVTVTNSDLTAVTYGYVLINNVRISTTVDHENNSNASRNAEIKSVIGNAGTIVQFQNCSGIVTGYEEDA